MRMKNNKVSIITVVLNRVSTIEKTIRSVLMQSYNNIEYIIVDGGSTDGTLDIIKHYSEQISLWISEPDKGIYDAMNKGLQLATGDVIAYLNSDDWYELDAIDYIVKEMYELNADILFAGVKRIGGANRDIITIPYQDYINRYYYKGLPTSHQSIFAKKEALTKFNGFNITYKIAADFYWFLQCLDAGFQMKCCAKVTSNFSIGGISTVENKKCYLEIKEIALSFTKNKEVEKEVAYYYKYTDNLRKYKNNIYKLDYKFNKEFIESISINKPIYIFGAGKIGKLCYESLLKMNIKVTGFIDNNLLGKEYQGISVMTSEILNRENIFVIIATTLYENEIANQLESFSLKENRDFYRYSKIIDYIVNNI